MFKQFLINTRFGNLFIIGLTQFFGYKHFSINGLDLNALFVIICTVAIAFLGYVINDYYDFELDKTNRPGKNLFEFKIFSKYGRLIYALGNLIVVSASVYFLRELTYLFAFIILSLLLYSRTLVKLPLVGNVLVAGCMAAVILFPLSGNLVTLGPEETMQFVDYNSKVLMFFGFFAFLAGLQREIIKDLEDKKGDQKYGYKTLAIVASINTNKTIVYVVNTFLLLGTCYFTYFQFTFWLESQSSVAFYYYLFIVLPIIARVYFLNIKAENQKDWSRLSQWLKIVMLAGVISLPLLKYAG